MASGIAQTFSEMITREMASSLGFPYRVGYPAVEPGLRWSWARRHAPVKAKQVYKITNHPAFTRREKLREISLQ